MKFSKTSPSPSSPAPRSACWASTALAKSSLLRIMAGVDKDYHGEARPQPGIKIGYLPQEPQLNPAKDVRGNIEEAVQPIKDALSRLDAVYAAYADADADFDALAKEQAEVCPMLSKRVAGMGGHGAPLSFSAHRALDLQYALWRKGCTPS